jgi:hypothetical protein
MNKKPAGDGAPTDLGEEAVEKLKRLNHGDASLVPWLKALLAQDATGELVNQFNGDLSQAAVDKVLDRVLGDSLIVREALRRKVEMVRDGLAGPNPSALERIVAGRAVFCWAVVYWFEANYARLAGDLTLAQAEFHQRRIDRAHQRFLSSVTALAKLRRLKLPTPAVQINVNQGVRMEYPQPVVLESGQEFAGPRFGAAPGTNIAETLGGPIQGRETRP